MKREPKIKPRLMWGVICSRGFPVYADVWRSHDNQVCTQTWQATVRRVLVTTPPKRRKRR